MTRVYLSNLRSAWPIARQEEVLDRDVPGWRAMAIYQDVLPQKRIEDAPLVQRDEFLLRASTRQSGGTLIVAALPVLSRTPTDLMAVMMRLAARRETLRSLAEGHEADPAKDDLDALKAAFLGASRRFSELGVPGGVASGKKRSEEASAKIDLIRPFWGLLEPTTAELCRQFGVSRPTVLNALGSRRKAQRIYAEDLRKQLVALNLAERNRSRRKQA